ncbi:MAG: hypothetical protein LDL41_16840 [Coleofasciculus sp. S288]|nr:hypothetical protein [Coleofasciculus sp. S288]
MNEITQIAKHLGSKNVRMMKLRLTGTGKRTSPMVQSAPTTLTVDEFITHYSDMVRYATLTHHTDRGFA